MPHAVIDPPAQAHLRHEPDREQHRAQSFRQQRTQEDQLHEGDEPAQSVIADAVHHDLSLPQSQPFPQQEEEQRSNGHKAQSAGLDQENDDDLSEGGPVSSGILGHQSRYAGGGGRGEQGVQEGGAAGGVTGGGQHQQPRSQRNHNKEA